MEQHCQPNSKAFDNCPASIANLRLFEGIVTFKAGTNVNLNAPSVALDAGTTIEKGCKFKVSN